MVLKFWSLLLLVKTLARLQVLRIRLVRVTVSRRHLLVSRCRPVVELVAVPSLIRLPLALPLNVVNCLLNLWQTLFLLVILKCSCPVPLADVYLSRIVVVSRTFVSVVVSYPPPKTIIFSFVVVAW